MDGTFVDPATALAPRPNQCYADPPELPVAREIKRRLERFVGQEPLKVVLRAKWDACRRLRRGDFLDNGKKRGDCFSEAVFGAILDGTLNASHAPVHASPWLRRALIYTQLAMLSGPDALRGLAEKTAPGSGSTCGGALASRGHPFSGVMASLVGDRFRAPRPAEQRYTNRFHDELAWGNFALYRNECRAVYQRLVPEVPDTDGDGVNDIYDTCPDTACRSGWQVDPTGDHVGSACQPASVGACIVRE
jgi:hypothetical protein